MASLVAALIVRVEQITLLRAGRLVSALALPDRSDMIGLKPTIITAPFHIARQSRPELVSNQSVKEILDSLTDAQLVRCNAELSEMTRKWRTLRGTMLGMDSMGMLNDPDAVLWH